MKRKLTLAMLLSLSAASPLALALGLGEADVRSTLNAPLRATIPLIDSAGIQAGLLNVSVADERAFAAAGLPRTPLAASVRLAVDQRQGRLVVDLTTERPVREPWLDLLLRFDWPGGQQLREVTLLLDPPDYDQMPALVSGGRRAAPAPAAAAEPSRATSPAAVAPRPSASPASSGDPAWVRSGDTLWAVAGRLRPDSGISMNQMMVALVEANPEAFPSGNINAMRAGFTLVVPSREAIAARAGAEADRLVGEMNRAWANRGSGAPARVALGSASAPSAPPAPPQGPVVAAPVAEALPEAPAGETGEAMPAAAAPAVDEPVAAAQGPRLTLLTDAQVAAEGEAGGDAGEVDVEGEAGDDAGEADVEGGAALEIDPDLLDALPGRAPSGDGQLSSDERLVRLEARWLESQQTLEAVQEERDELQGELGEMRQQLEALQEQLAALAAGGAGADGPGAGGIAMPGSEAEETPWWGAVYQGEVDRNLMLGGAGLAALLALWLVVRRRRREEEGGGATAGTVQVGVPGAQPPVPPQASPAPGAAPAHSIQGSLPQAEAISEADIFIAYGRYDQARELLDTSLAREPERDDLRLKLLTVHLEQGNREEAEQEARRLRAGGSPAVREEVERLLERHGVPLPTPAADSSAEQGATPLSQGEKARFGHPAERPPRVFGEGADDAPGQDGAPSAGDVPSGDQAAAPPEAGKERFAAAPGAGRPTAPEPGASEPDAPEPDASEPEASPLPEIATRRLDDGREIIDYRPPSLDEDPAPREETPMQPSVEFTSSRLDVVPEEEPEALPQEWEVEEVSFPPLEADNVGSSSSAATERLAEARRMVDAGEVERARSLLGELVLSDDPAIHDAAAALLNRLDT
ncbi:FimV/HubP family polar landmark protein [Halomonas mongoliensis]|uniref:FimV/HubP family polar landmark protein n=1 Tax=Halomonas mongoliensis TaxID=321265 RepID=UPI00403A9A8E